MALRKEYESSIRKASELQIKDKLMIKCFRCNNYGHKAYECKEELKKEKWVSSKRSEGKRMNDFNSKKAKIGISDLEFLKMKNPGIIRKEDEKIEFCPIMKCKITTEPGKRVSRKGVVCP